jgi:predicted metal-dependent phosphoesterase TrpH
MDTHIPPCDLHLHSCFSDGTMSPEELVSYARAIGLSAISITDHDTMCGQEEALEAGRRCGIEVVTGIEFSVEQENMSLHILGYLFDHENCALAANLKELAEARVSRAREIVRRLEDHGVSIPFAEVLSEAGKGCVGRPHIARVLYRRGHVMGVSEAFVRYIADDAPCHVPKKVLPLETVVRLINDAGGVAAWAHPGWNIKKKDIVDRLLASGVRGIEVWHPNHSERLTSEIMTVARARGLVSTGGSDFHCAELMQADIGEITAPYESIIALRKAAAHMRHLA